MSFNNFYNNSEIYRGTWNKPILAFGVQNNPILRGLRIIQPWRDLEWSGIGGGGTYNNPAFRGL